jgi:hypothetical protein
MMSDSAISDQFRMATLERIARYTVGIAVERNTGVGTGTLVSVGGERFVLTAAHVIGESKPTDIRFWLRPPAPIKEKAAADTKNDEIGGFTLGVQLPISDIWIDRSADIAAMKLDPSFILPVGVDLYNVLGSREFMSWEDSKLDGLSLVLFGFPVENSREVFAQGNRSFRYLGCASHLSKYSVELNSSVWPKLSSKHSQSRDFAFNYDDLNPHGFSGGGVWVLGHDPKKMVWRPDPILVGVVHDYVRRLGILIATKLPAFIEAHVVPPGAPNI